MGQTPPGQHHSVFGEEAEGRPLSQCSRRRHARDTNLVELGHPQAATPIQTDNSCATGLANDTIKQLD
jgi:hypothetical protein